MEDEGNPVPSLEKGRCNDYLEREYEEMKFFFGSAEQPYIINRKEGNDMEWKPIFLQNEKTVYEISENGDVKHTIKNTILNQHLINSGYYTVGLYNNGENKRFLVHRLVAQIFIPNPNLKQEVHHKNHIKTDNHKDNLEWVTKSENMYYSYEEGSHSKQIKVYQYSLEGTLLKIFKSQSEAVKNSTASQAQISRCCTGIAKSAGGFQWSFKKKQMPNISKDKTTTAKKTAKLNKEKEILEIYSSASQAGKNNNISAGDIIRVCNGQRKTAGGYSWKYL